MPGDGEDEPSESALAAARNEVVKQVARTLGNTPAMARKAYIDPVVFAGWRDGSLQRAAAAAGEGGARGARRWEQATLKFLKCARRQARKKKS